MKNTLILIDFDHTIFNTTKYVVALKNRLTDVGVAPEIFDEKRQYLKDCCSLVDIDTFILQLPVSNKQLLHNTIHDVIVETAASCVHSDVADFLVRQNACADIIIITNGDKELQTEKMEHSNLKYITKTVITKKPKNEAVASSVKKYKKIVFIDDKTKHLDEVKQAFPTVITYHMRRTDDMPYGAIPSQCACADHEVQSLTEINEC